MLVQIGVGSADPIPQRDRRAVPVHLGAQNHHIIHRLLRVSEAGMDDDPLRNADHQHPHRENHGDGGLNRFCKGGEFQPHKGKQGVKQDNADQTQAHQCGKAVARDGEFEEQSRHCQNAAANQRRDSSRAEKMKKGFHFRKLQVENSVTANAAFRSAALCQILPCSLPHYPKENKPPRRGRPANSGNLNGGT